jgi:hypothetical protein
MKLNVTNNETGFEKLWLLIPRIVNNTPTGAVAWISILLNILVVATFLKIRKFKGRLPQAWLHFIGGPGTLLKF